MKMQNSGPVRIGTGMFVETFGHVIHKDDAGTH